MKTIRWTMVLALAIVGCSESRADEDAGGTPMDSGGGSTDAGRDAGTARDSGMTGTDGGGSIDGLAINEIDANGEWSELYNTSSASIDLSGVRVTDSEAGAPRVDRAFAFPDGFSLGGGEYILVVEADPPVPGIQTGAACPVGTRCLHTDWGISDSMGETIHVLPPAGDDTPLLSQEYPALAVADGLSYCRLPNGTGDFGACMPTPEAANEAAP